MGNDFDITLERKLESNGDCAAVGVSEVRRIELITGAVRRRRWSRTDKARIVLESLQPGANVSEVARRNGLSPQQLFAWRREAEALFNDGIDIAPADQAAHAPAPQPHRKAGQQAQPPEIGEAAPVFAPVVIAAPAPPSPSAPSRPPAADSGTIEIAIGGAVVRIIGQVETSMLIAVLRAVRRAS
jgi:transposase